MPNHKTQSPDQIALDDDDKWILQLYPWTVTQCGDMLYVRLLINGQMVYLHRFITRAAKGQLVDHRNLNGLDNRRDNLRLCSKSQNMMNRGLQRNSTSGVKGVYYDKSRSKWYAHIKIDGKAKYLGRFASLDEARESYDRAALRYHGEFARINNHATMSTE